MKRSATWLSMLSCVAALQMQPASAAVSGLGFVEAEVLKRINAERTAVGLDILLEDLGLNAAARAHSEDMAVHGCFDHYGCDGTAWTTRIASHYPPTTSLGEIIGAGFATPDDVVDAWMDSPDHRADILNSAFKVAGVGWAEGDPDVPYVTYYTVDFGDLTTLQTVMGVVPEPASAALMALGLAGLLLRWRSQRTY